MEMSLIDMDKFTNHANTSTEYIFCESWNQIFEMQFTHHSHLFIFNRRPFWIGSRFGHTLNLCHFSQNHGLVLGLQVRDPSWDSIQFGTILVWVKNRSRLTIGSGPVWVCRLYTPNTLSHLKQWWIPITLLIITHTPNDAQTIFSTVFFISNHSPNRK